MAKQATMDATGYRVFNVFNTILMVVVCAAMLYPFLYLVAQSFSSTEAIVAGEVGLIPKDFSIETYAYVINDGRFIPYYGNTILYSVIGTVSALFFSTPSPSRSCGAARSSTSSSSSRCTSAAA